MKIKFNKGQVKKIETMHNGLVEILQTAKKMLHKASAGTYTVGDFDSDLNDLEGDYKYFQLDVNAVFELEKIITERRKHG